MKARLILSTALLALMAVCATLWAGDSPSSQTVITVEKMHCQGCAKRIATKLKHVPGVADVKPDVETKTLTVVPKSRTALSPRALWEAVEKANDTVVRLVGPNGEFTKKPRF